MKCSLHVLNHKIHNRVGKLENSIRPGLELVKISLDLSLKCFYEMVLKNECV